MLTKMQKTAHAPQNMLFIRKNNIQYETMLQRAVQSRNYHIDSFELKSFTKQNARKCL